MGEKDRSVRESGVLCVLMTAPDEETASRIADDLVGSGSAACCNILPGIESVYRWKGEIQRDREALVIIKCTTESFPGIKARVEESHPYQTPELIALPVVDGLETYLNWVRTESRG